jgi:hypothetical protein
MVHKYLAAVPVAIVVLQTVAGVGGSILARDIRVTLLDARRLTFEHYREARKPDPAAWAGGGFHFSFLVENRPGAPLPPALGEVRVLIKSQLYNVVANANSRKPLAPLIVVLEQKDFLLRHMVRPCGHDFPCHVPKQAVVLDVFIPGGSVAERVAGVVELELGETFRHDSHAKLRALTPEEIDKTWMNFHFVFPQLE